MTLVRIARYYVGSDSAAEDVVQETWIAVMRSAKGFEGRSSVKTWLIHIVANRARSSAARERRSVAVDPVDPVSASRFDQGGMWSEPPVPFTDRVDGRLDNAELLAAAKEAINELAEPQRSVVTLRDVEGLSTGEVAELLELSEANVRVILHRARAKVRDTLEVTMRKAQL
jgi:RNA polymerase sigma-70 factor (ECF subfamily)